MTLLDHLLALIILAVHPIAGYVTFQHILRRIAAGEQLAATLIYRRTLIGHWTLFAITIAIWFGLGRPASTLGFGLDLDAWFLVAALFTVVAVVVMALQLRRLGAASPLQLQAIRYRLFNIEVILPKSAADLRQFYAVAVTAGIVEETLWRGFLFWYLGQFLPLWAVAVISVIGFCLAHAYQGIGNLAKVTLVGASFAALFVVSGSLWLPMLLHALIDALQGRAVYGVLQRT